MATRCAAAENAAFDQIGPLVDSVINLVITRPDNFFCGEACATELRSSLGAHGAYLANLEVPSRYYKAENWKSRVLL